MNVCFECGGKLKLIAKPGRMVWDEDELYEIPQEIKISACLDCGEPFEDSFVKTKIQRAVEGQKKQKPSARLLHLRWIDTFLLNMLKRPRMYGEADAIHAQVILSLNFRELVLSKGEVAKESEIQEALRRHLRKRWPEMGCLAIPDADLVSEFAPALREFCDVWINT